ncbi:MAG: peptidoglycan DD-metalloendopeptidase family protein [bacterium]
MKTAAGFLAAIFLFQSPQLYASKIDTEIQKIDADIEESNKTFYNLKKEIEGISEKLDTLSKKKKLTSSKINSISNQMSKLTQKILSLNAEYKNHKKKLQDLTNARSKTEQQELNARIFLTENRKQSVVLKAGEKKYMELFLVDYESSFRFRINEFLLDDLLEKVSVFSDGCRQKILGLEEKLSAVEKTLADLEIMLEDISYKVSTNKNLRKNYAKTLEEMQSEEGKLQKDLQIKEKDKDNLDRMIEKFMKKKKNLLAEKEKQKEFSEIKGLLPYPVKGYIISHFGKKKHPDLQTYIINRGIKIKSSTDTVRAVKEGTTSFAGPFKGYGKTVIIDHGGGFYTVTAGLSELLINEGVAVRQGEPVGKCLTGNEVYFEIREDGIPVDPVLWLE